MSFTLFLIIMKWLRLTVISLWKNYPFKLSYNNELNCYVRSININIVLNITKPITNNYKRYNTSKVYTNIPLIVVLIKHWSV